MRAETIARLRCPQGCASDLDLIAKEAEGGRIRTGWLDCPACGQRYPIENGIARMLPAQLAAPALTVEAAASLAGSAVRVPAGSPVGVTAMGTDGIEAARKRSEMTARDAQVGAYDRMRGLALFGKLEIPLTLAQTRPGPNDVLLEAGCGTGRMSRAFAARCGSLICVDFSFESLRVCQRKLEAAGVENADLVQADVCALPFQSCAFSKVVSCQVLEHIPTPASRQVMIAELARVAQPGATVVISAYQHSLFTRLFDKKEGAHAGGIYYYRFGRRELRDLLATAMDVRSLTGILIYHYLARCRKPPTVALTLDKTNATPTEED